MTSRCAPDAIADPGESGVYDSEEGDEGPDGPPGPPGADGDGFARRAIDAADRVLRVPVSPRALAATLAAAAAFAVAVTLVSSSASQRWWGACAAVFYSLAALIVMTARRHGGALAALVALVGSLIVPLASMPANGLAQRDEVAVISRSAVLLLGRGSPYQGASALAAAHSYTAYNPYLPVLAVFGIPRALAGVGVLTDPRVWFGVVFLATFGAGITLMGRARPAWWMVLISASPLIAYPLSTGGDDLPVLGLECLGLALLHEADDRARARPVAAGVVLGLAAAMKATAWPGLAVALALVAHRYGWRATARFVAAALAVAGLAIIPVALSAPRAMLINTIEFPLGLAPVASPAASVLPGHVIATLWNGGRWVAIGLLVIAAVCVLVSLIVRPPTSPQSAGARLALGLSLMFLLGPASRIGYIVYPLGLLTWLGLAPGSRLRPAALAVLLPGSSGGSGRGLPAEPQGPAAERGWRLAPRQASGTPGPGQPPAPRRRRQGAEAASSGQPPAPRRRRQAWCPPDPPTGRRFVLGPGHPPVPRPAQDAHRGPGGRLPPTSAGRKPH